MASAVTCDDFIDAMNDANKKNVVLAKGGLGQFMRWYSQAGTPSVSFTSTYDKCVRLGAALSWATSTCARECVCRGLQCSVVGRERRDGDVSCCARLRACSVSHRSDCCPFIITLLSFSLCGCPVAVSLLRLRTGLRAR